MSKKRKYAIVLVTILWVLVVGTIVGEHFDFFKSPTHRSRGMVTIELQAFNSNFTSYEGEQTGSQVKALIQKLIANAKTYTEEPKKIPRVKYNISEDDKTKAKDWQENDKGGKITSSVLTSDAQGQKDYTKALSELSNGISAKHTYFVDLNTMDEELINEIIIYYDETEGEYSYSKFKYNSRYTPYKGEQKGAQTKLLLENLIENAKTYSEEPDKIPSVKYITSENDNFRAKKWQESDKGGKITSGVLESNSEGQEKYSKALEKLSKYIKDKHTYFIELNTMDNGYIGEIIIYYDKDEEEIFVDE